MWLTNFSHLLQFLQILFHVSENPSNKHRVISKNDTNHSSNDHFYFGNNSYLTGSFLRNDVKLSLSVVTSPSITTFRTIAKIHSSTRDSEMTQTTFLPHLVPSMNVSRHLNRRDVPLSDISIFRKKMNKLRSGSYYAEPVFNDSDNSTTTKIITVFPLTTPKRVKVHVEKASFYPSAMSCRVTVICEHSFFFDAGFADKGITSGIISYHLHHVDRLLRRLDFGDDGRPDYLGLRLHNIVYSNLFGVTDILWKRPDFSCKTLFDAVRNASTVEVCYVLVYTHIDTIDCPPKSYSWGAKNELEIGGICGNKEKPNVGVVNFRDAKLDKLLVDGVKRVLEVMIQAFGNTQMEGYKVEMVNQDENQIFDKRALDIMSQGLSRHSKCLTLTVPLRKKPVFDYYDDDGAIHVFPPWTIILIPAVVMIVSQ